MAVAAHKLAAASLVPYGCWSSVTPAEGQRKLDRQPNAHRMRLRRRAQDKMQETGRCRGGAKRLDRGRPKGGGAAEAMAGVPGGHAVTASGAWRSLRSLRAWPALPVPLRKLKDEVVHTLEVAPPGHNMALPSMPCSRTSTEPSE